MLPADMIRQIRRLQFRARRAVDDLLGGEYHSVFKGRGVAFDEVREYQPGDDVRTIDWNVTARMGHPFVKRYVEERELTVMLLVDCSGSQDFGTGTRHKRDVAAELAAVLAFSAVGNNDKIGLIGFTDRVERFVPPRKGARHALRLIRDVLYFQPSRTGTCLREALGYLNRVLRRRAIVFVLSDFLADGYARALKRAARRHDLIAVRLEDVREGELPPVGLLTLEDAETGQTALVDTSRPLVRHMFAAATADRREQVRQLARAAQIDLIEVDTAGGHIDALVRFFRLRDRRLRRT